MSTNATNPNQFRFPVSTEWEKWRPQFEKSFLQFMNSFSRFFDGQNIKVFRIYSNYNGNTYEEFRVDGGWKLVVNGHTKASWDP